MKAGIFDPYLDTLGGGERYCLTLAETLLKEGWQVDIFWPMRDILSKLQTKFQLKIEKINFVNYAPRQKTLWQRWQFEKNYDLLFYLSDGSVPFMFGKKNWLHFQVPFSHLTQTLLNKVKIAKIDKIICNSHFTEEVVDQRLGVNSVVVYPPVEVALIKPLKKEKIILSVGRFSQLLQEKRQDVLVTVFKNLIDKRQLPGWRLILAGGSEVGGRAFVTELKEEAAGYPIEVKENPAFKELTQLYGKATIFWTASGFGVDEEREPERVEHFGITTVEAMAGGAIPIIQGKGGQKEIVEEGESGEQWLDQEELAAKTQALINDRKRMKHLAGNAILRSKLFSKEEFSKTILGLLK